MSIEIGATVKHVFYPALVGEVLNVSERFGVSVRWKSEDKKVRHLCREQRHPAQFLVLENESIPEMHEGLRCMENETLDMNPQEKPPEIDFEEVETQPEIIADEPIEEALLSEPLPTEPEDLEDEFEEEFAGDET